ncbi:non-specific serine/threonine protein kinase [Tsukamurella hominis]
MGEVYLVEHPRLPRRDALKLLDADVSRIDDFKARFIRESEILAGLKHPHIIQIHDRGEVDGRLWLTMEYVDGRDVAQLLQSSGPMPMELALDVTQAVASALDYAWRTKGLTHRDVKPANILIAFDPSGRIAEVKLADFGIAKAAGDATSLSAAGATVGTLKYMSPEAISGEALDSRADEYSLACTVYQMIAGRVPFAGAAADVVSGHLTRPVPSLNSSAATLNQVFARALAKRAADRYPSCEAFAADLRRAASVTADASPTVPQFGGISTLPSADPAPARSRLRRGAPLVAGAVALVVALVAATLAWRSTPGESIAGEAVPLSSSPRSATPSAEPTIAVSAAQLVPSEQDVKDLTSNDAGFWNVDRTDALEAQGGTVSPAECTWVASGSPSANEASRATVRYRHPTPNGRLTFGLSITTGAVVFRAVRDAEEVFARMVREFTTCTKSQIQLTSPSGSVMRITSAVTGTPSEWQLWSTMTYEDVGFYCTSSDSRVRNAIVSITRCLDQADQSNVPARLTAKSVSLARTL